MPEKEKKIEPRTFYLNECHELTRGEKTGRGSPPAYINIDWAAKGSHIRNSLKRVRETIARSRDPLRQSQFFMIASPEKELTKASKDVKKAPQGTVLQVTAFSKEHSRVFHRIGLDLVDVTADGRAVVRGRPEEIDRLVATCGALAQVGLRERTRYAMIDAFATVPRDYRVDAGWLDKLPQRQPTDVVIELQPLLNRTEVETVLRAIHDILKEKELGKIEHNGRDYSGRHWFRGHILKVGLSQIADAFFSIQSLHPPQFSLAAASGPHRSGRQKPLTLRAEAFPEPTTKVLPTVGVVDLGIPADHVSLRQYRRGQYIAPGSFGRSCGAHGSLVASRVVYGDPDCSAGSKNVPPPTCQYYDINVAETTDLVSDKNVMPALEAVVSTAPDVRIFNLSFDHPVPLSRLGRKDHDEALILLQDLDNFIFATDCVVVVSAGNTQNGLVPSGVYPMHLDEDDWQLGTWARSFNALTCGGSVGRISPNGLVANVGWPSPFTRIGPGLANSPKVDFCDNAGNCTSNYQWAPGLGVYAIDDQGRWEDHCGTSYAAPLLARECAFAAATLQNFCQQGARPYAATIKAFLSLTATPVVGIPEEHKDLFRRALGRGHARSDRLIAPMATTAVMIWQGILQGPDDCARVQIPIPFDWYKATSHPMLRLVAAWESPVHAAVRDLWACRAMTIRLRPRPDARALRGTGGSHQSYPLIEKVYDLKRLPSGIKVDGDNWVIDLNYSEIADYHPGMDFMPQQRVAFALELYDKSETPVSPQPYIQAMPVAVTMNRLSVPPATVRVPVVIGPRV